MEALGIPSLRDEIDRIDRQLVKLLAARQASSVEIARRKADRDLQIYAPDREAELIAEAREDAAALDIDPDYAEELMALVLRYSKEAQRRALEADDDPG
jgi:chorismate mutase